MLCVKSLVGAVRRRVLFVRRFQGITATFKQKLTVKKKTRASNGKPWGQLRDELAKMVQNVLHLEPFVIDRFADASAAGMKLSGLIVLSDWIASNPETYHYNDLSKVDPNKTPEEYWAAAQAEGRSAVHRLQLDVLDASSSALKFDRLLPAFSEVWQGMPPRPTQAALEAALKDNLCTGAADYRSSHG